LRKKRSMDFGGGYGQLGLVFGFLFVFLILYYVPKIFFLITQQNLLKAIKPENRMLEPGLVWLQLVPVFALGWQFYVVTKISESLKREFYSWSTEDTILGYADPDSVMLSTEQPAYGIGIAYCILICCTIIPYFGCLALVGALVCWIIYWVKLAEYKTKVTRHNLGFL